MCTSSIRFMSFPFFLHILWYVWMKCEDVTIMSFLTQFFLFLEYIVIYNLDLKEINTIFLNCSKLIFSEYASIHGLDLQ